MRLLSKRISIRALLALTALCAGLVVLWQTFIYEPPTHKILAYERAPSTQKLRMRVGPNTIAIQSVARNRSDGTLVVETGAGKPIAGQVPNSEVLSACAKWLDVAQFELSPGTDRFEVIEARVFDHSTRILLPELSAAFGWQVVGNNLLQVYGLGKELPSSLDVWLRVHSYDANDQAVILPPNRGASITLPATTITLTSLQRGFAGWNSNTGFLAVEDEADARTALVLGWTGQRTRQDYQIAATSKAGDKQFYDRFLSVHAFNDGQEMLTFDIPLEEIDHFEVRPHRGRHRFFFEAVQLPRTPAGRKFDDPPTARLAVRGEQSWTALAQLQPLRAEISLFKGEAVTGVSHNATVSQLHRTSTPTAPENSFTAAWRIYGMAYFPAKLALIDSDTGSYVAEPIASSSEFGASGLNDRISVKSYSLPLERIGGVELAPAAAR